MGTEYLSLNPALTIDEAVAALGPDKVLIFTDKNVEREVLPRLTDSKIIKETPLLAMEAGEENKNLDTVVSIWNKLEEIGATRQSLLLNIGGGVVTDLGGFAAAIFKRGIRTINFPTTLLGAVDAATGGKTGIDFNGLKNEIGAFHMPSRVIVSPLPFDSLPEKEILSGYAEMVKTALISDREFYISLLKMEEVTNSPALLGEYVAKCVGIKDEVVTQDPTEKGLRKILNFGHTAGHAFESLRIARSEEVTHGEAVAHGMLVALLLSNSKLGFPMKDVEGYKEFLKKYYGKGIFDPEDTDKVIEKINSDKKNRNYGRPLFSLLESVGVPVVNVEVSVQEIKEALKFYRSLMDS